MITTVKLREEAMKTTDPFVRDMYRDAADTIEELYKYKEGLIRVAAEALAKVRQYEA